MVSGVRDDFSTGNLPPFRRECVLQSARYAKGAAGYGAFFEKVLRPMRRHDRMLGVRLACGSIPSFARGSGCRVPLSSGRSLRLLDSSNIIRSSIFLRCRVRVVRLAVPESASVGEASSLLLLLSSWLNSEGCAPPSRKASGARWRSGTYKEACLACVNLVCQYKRSFAMMIQTLDSLKRSATMYKPSFAQEDEDDELGCGPDSRTRSGQFAYLRSKSPSPTRLDASPSEDHETSHTPPLC